MSNFCILLHCSLSYDTGTSTRYTWPGTRYPVCILHSISMFLNSTVLKKKKKKKKKKYAYHKRCLLNC